MGKLETEFEKPTFEAWVAKIQQDLKGQPLSVLTSHPEPDLEITAFHHEATRPQLNERETIRNFAKKSNDWKIRQEFKGKLATNSAILTALNDGIEAIGVAINSSTNYQNLVNEVQFEYIDSDLQFKTLNDAISIKAHSSTVLNFDFLALNAQLGQMSSTWADYLKFYQSYPTNKTIWISGSLYGGAGSSTIQELGFTLAHLNEYVDFLTKEGVTLAEINSKIVIELSVNEDYFVNIAKFRVIQDLVRLVFKGYDPAYQVLSPIIYAKTNLRYLAKNDKNNNPIRQTTQAMSAVIGGCDVLTVDYGDFGSEIEVARFRRIAKNIQLILKEEAYLDKVVDPSGGAYYIESLTDQLLQKAWKLFLDTEALGGVVEGLKSGFVQSAIDSNKNHLISELLSGHKTYLGVNKHPNNMEKWIDLTPETSEKTFEFSPLEPFYLENHFSKTVENHA
jgi:methylmalonyl-CoA mutase